MTQAIITALGAILVYLFGRWQAEHERLYERRAQVIAELFSRFEEVDQVFYSLFHWYDPGGEPDKQEKARLAAESFNDLQAYYRRNSIWLPLRTSNRFNDVLARYRKPFIEFTSEVIRWEDDPPERGVAKKWLEVWEAFQKDSAEIRWALDTEFRAALGSWRAKLAILLEYVPVSRLASRNSPSDTSRQ